MSAYPGGYLSGGVLAPSELDFGARLAVVEPLAVAAAPKSTLMRNVRSFGAKGDGVTSDTQAIVDAYVSLPAAGGTLYFPGGTDANPAIYPFLGSLAQIFTKPVRFEGDGRTVSTIKNIGTTGQHCLWLKGNGSSLRGLTIDGQRGAQSASTGSAVQFSGTGSAPLVPVHDISITDCEVKGNGFDCVGLTAVDGGVVARTIVRDVFDSGIDLVEGTVGVDVDGNHIYCNGRFGIALDTADSVNYLPVRAINLRGNRIVLLTSADTRYGMVFQTASDVHVLGGSVDGSAAGLSGVRFDNEFLRGSCKGVAVIGGGPALTRGIQVEGLTQQTKVVEIEGCSVVNMTLANSEGIGIDNAIGVIVRGNLLDNCKRGIDVESSSAKPVSAIELGGNILKDCVISVRLAGTTGNGVVKLDKHYFLGAFTFRYAFDSGFTVNLGSEDDLTTSGSIDAASKVLAPRLRESGSAPVAGLATLVAGTVTVNTTAVTANSRIQLTAQNSGAAPGTPRVSARVPGTSFTITSTSGTDTSSVAWQMSEAL